MKEVNVYVPELDYTFKHGEDELKILKKNVLIVYNRETVEHWFQVLYRTYKNVIITIN